MDFSYPDGATPLSPDEKEGLKLSHIAIREELDRWEQQNITDAYNWLESRRGTSILSKKFLRTLHEKMFGKVSSWAGDFRQTNKNIGVDWPQVPMETQKLIDDTTYWIQHETFYPDEIAARLHHRLVEIHLFTNGNGRHARLVADHLLVKQFDAEPFTWGSGNLIAEGEVRSAYIDSLRAADQRDCNLLLNFVRS